LHGLSTAIHLLTLVPFALFTGSTLTCASRTSPSTPSTTLVSRAADCVAAAGCRAALDHTPNVASNASDIYCVAAAAPGAAPPPCVLPPWGGSCPGCAPSFAPPRRSLVLPHSTLAHCDVSAPPDMTIFSLKHSLLAKTEQHLDKTPNEYIQVCVEATQRLEWPLRLRRLRCCRRMRLPCRPQPGRRASTTLHLDKDQAVLGPLCPTGQRCCACHILTLTSLSDDPLCSGAMLWARTARPCRR
jgi:hypothetical protein